MKVSAVFSNALLHPRYWHCWLGISLLWMVVQLPYPALFHLGSFLGRWARPFLKRREYIAGRNLELCFPQLNQTQRDKLLTENFESLGMALIETGMAWFWSDQRLRKWSQVEGLVGLQHAQQNKRGIMVIGTHFMSLDLGGRVMGLSQPMMATYRPHNNPMMEWIQTYGRLRSNKAMINRRNLRKLVSELKKGEAVWFAPDQDNGRKGCVFVPFFNVPDAATTNGPFVLSKLSGAGMLTVSLIRKKDASGYRLIIGTELQDYPVHDEQAAAVYMNRIIEQEILRAPEQYLWMHRRFKTRPKGSVRLYS